MKEKIQCQISNLWVLTKVNKGKKIKSYIKLISSSLFKKNKAEIKIIISDNTPTPIKPKFLRFRTIYLVSLILQNTETLML